MKRLIVLGVAVAMLGYASVLFRCWLRGWWDAFDFFIGVGQFVIVLGGLALAVIAVLAHLDKEAK